MALEITCGHMLIYPLVVVFLITVACMHVIVGVHDTIDLSSLLSCPEKTGCKVYVPLLLGKSTENGLFEAVSQFCTAKGTQRSI